MNTNKYSMVTKAAVGIGLIIFVMTISLGLYRILTLRRTMNLDLKLYASALTTSILGALEEDFRIASELGISRSDREKFSKALDSVVQLTDVGYSALLDNDGKVIAANAGYQG